MRWHMLFDNRPKKTPLVKVEYAVSISFSTTFQVHYYDELDIPRIKEYNGDNWLTSFMVPSISRIRSERRYLLAGLHAFEGWFILGD